MGSCGEKSSWISPKLLVSLALGQVLSFCITGTAVSSKLLSQNSNNGSTAMFFPAFQSFLNYFLLAVIWGAVRLYRIRRDKFHEYQDIDAVDVNFERSYQTMLPAWRMCGLYALLAFVDVEANFLLILSYKFTNILSIMLLDSWAIPCVMVAGYLISRKVPSMRDQYAVDMFPRVLGVTVCLVGLVLLAFEDFRIGSIANDESLNPLLGDMLVLLGASLYAVSNLTQEYFCRTRETDEILMMLGICGSLVAGIQFLALEFSYMLTITWAWSGVGYLTVFTGSLFTLYSLTPFMLRRSSAALFNLSLLTSDFYGAVFGVFLFSLQFTALYSIAFALIVVGMIVYNSPLTWKKQSLQDLDSEVLV